MKIGLNLYAKKNIFALALVFITIASPAQDKKTEEGREAHHCFVEEHSISFGLGLPYSLALESIGFNARVYYNLTEKICFGPEASYFKKDEKVIQDIEFVGHYIFETKWVGIYPLLGMNYTQEIEHEHTIDAFGLVYGLGAHRNFGRFTSFLEYSQVRSKLKDDLISIGLFYRLPL